MESLITASEAAKRLGMSNNALATLRSRGGGPRYVKVGRSVRYDPADIAKWVEAHKITPGLTS